LAINLRGNIMSQWGLVPMQKYYGLGSANAWEDDHSSFWQAVSSISNHFSTQAHFMNEGGAGVRGYMNEFATSGFGLNGELMLPNPIRSWGWIADSFTPLLFADAGWVGTTMTFDRIGKGLMTDAGIGLKWNILSWLPWQLQGVAQEYSNIPTIGF